MFNSFDDNGIRVISAGDPPDGPIQQGSLFDVVLNGECIGVFFAEEPTQEHVDRVLLEWFKKSATAKNGDANGLR